MVDTRRIRRRGVRRYAPHCALRDDDKKVATSNSLSTLNVSTAPHASNGPAPAGLVVCGIAGAARRRSLPHPGLHRRTAQRIAPPNSTRQASARLRLDSLVSHLRCRHNTRGVDLASLGREVLGKVEHGIFPMRPGGNRECSPRDRQRVPLTLLCLLHQSASPEEPHGEYLNAVTPRFASDADSRHQR